MLFQIRKKIQPAKLLQRQINRLNRISYSLKLYRKRSGWAILLITALISFLYFDKEYDSTTSSRDRIRIPLVRAKTSSLPYITLGLWTLKADSGSRLGNHMYEIAALHGIAAQLEMIPYVREEYRVKIKELQRSFPKLNPILMKDPNNAVAVDFGQKWAYNNVSSLIPYKKQNITLAKGIWYQSYRYFHHIRQDIRDTFSFAPDTLKTADNLIQYAYSELNLRNKYHDETLPALACLHIRRGDFVTHSFLVESRAEFVVKAVTHIREKEEGKKRILYFLTLSDDQEWSRRLFANDSFVFILPRSSEKTVDLAVMAKHCNIIVLTASVSTFGFWGAYLSDAEDVYYNVEIEKKGSTYFRKIFNPPDTFLPSWIALNFSSKNMRTIT